METGQDLILYALTGLEMFRERHYSVQSTLKKQKSIEITIKGVRLGMPLVLRKFT